MSDNKGNALILTNLILQALQRTQGYAALLNTAHTEVRDVTEAELDELLAQDTAVSDALKAEIARQRAAS